MLNVRPHRALGFAAAALYSVSALAADITGAGATFPYPIYAKWADAYKKETGIGMNYQSIGSGGGIKQITAKTVDFGASDMPMKPEELEKYGLMQFPAIMGGVVPVYNVKGVAPAPLKLTGPQAGRHLPRQDQEVERPGIAQAEPGREAAGPGDLGRAPLRRLGHHVHLHELPVEGERRMENQGRRRHRGEVADGRRRQGQRGRRLLRAADRRRHRLRRVRLRQAEQAARTARCRTRTGKFVAPDDETFKAAAAGADWARRPGMYLVLTDQAGKTSWPITGASFILMHKQQEKPETGEGGPQVLRLGLRERRRDGDELDYVPMPDSVVKHDPGGVEARDQGRRRQAVVLIAR